MNIWRIRLVGRGRTIGNRVTGNTVPEFESLILRQQKRQVLYLSFLLAMNHRSNFCFVALPRIEFASATKGVVSSLAKAPSQLIPKGNVSLIATSSHKFRDTF